VESRDRQMPFAKVHIMTVPKIQNRHWLLWCVFSVSFIPSMWIYTVSSYTVIIYICLFKMFSLMVASCVTSCSPLFPPPFLLLTLTSPPFASQILSSAPLPFLSVSYYTSSSPLPLSSTPLPRSVPVYTLLLMIRTVH